MADFAQIAQAHGELTIIAALLESAAWGALLSAAKPLTLFAPDDAAFAQLPTDMHTAIVADPAQLSALLADHAAPGILVAADLMHMASVTMISGRTALIDISLGLRIADSYLIQADLMADEGVLHILDKVLLP
jgi:uncharacterized surface protein with fasciclin (FAS1) repeats